MIASAILGTAVVATVVVAHRRAALDHVLAWWFQLTRKTETITAGAEGRSFTALCEGMGRGRHIVQAEVLLNVLAEASGRSVAWDPAGRAWAFVLENGEELRTTEDAGRILRACAWRVLEQRFPERAYFVLHGEPPPDAAGHLIFVESRETAAAGPPASPQAPE